MSFEQQHAPSLIRQAIFERLNTVKNVGKVQLYQRYAKRNSQLKEFYGWTNPTNDSEKYEGEIRGWFIRRNSFRQDRQANCYERTSVWQIEGFMSLDDETMSELQFDKVVDAIESAFRTDATLNGVIEGIGDTNEQGLQLIDSGPYMFSGVLCHGAKFQLIIRER